MATLPLGTMHQALPSRADLESILSGPSGNRIVAGYEILLAHYRHARHALDEIDRTLRVDAAEYVPAIRDVFVIIDRLNEQQPQPQETTP